MTRSRQHDDAEPAYKQARQNDNRHLGPRVPAKRADHHVSQQVNGVPHGVPAVYPLDECGLHFRRVDAVGGHELQGQ